MINDDYYYKLYPCAGTTSEPHKCNYCDDKAKYIISSYLQSKLKLGLVKDHACSFHKYELTSILFELKLKYEDLNGS